MIHALEDLRRRYETEEALALDPLAVVLGFRDAWDRELAAFLAAHLAYGRVAPMLRAIRAALAPLGEAPASWLRSLKAEEAREKLQPGLTGWKWRFHTGEDLVHWLLAWKRLDEESGHRGMEVCLAGGEEALSALVRRLRRELPPSPGLRFNLPDPAKGAACKRWRMMLRWMVRSGWPDLGQWQALPASGLVIPLDTHVAKVSRCIGLTRRATPDGRMALEITETLRSLDPGDPLKYDFALSHQGILGDCPGRFDAARCAACPLARLRDTRPPKGATR